MRYLYTLVLYSLMPLVVVRMLWRSRRLPEYRQRWRERFGFFGSLPVDRPVIWVHAVSVGETQAAVPMVQYLLDSHPGHRVLLTTTTPTGSRRTPRSSVPMGSGTSRSSCSASSRGSRSTTSARRGCLWM